MVSKLQHFTCCYNNILKTPPWNANNSLYRPMENITRKESVGKNAAMKITFRIMFVIWLLLFLKGNTFAQDNFMIVNELRGIKNELSFQEFNHPINQPDPTMSWLELIKTKQAFESQQQQLQVQKQQLELHKQQLEIQKRQEEIKMKQAFEFQQQQIEIQKQQIEIQKQQLEYNRPSERDQHEAQDFEKPNSNLAHPTGYFDSTPSTM